VNNLAIGVREVAAVGAAQVDCLGIVGFRLGHGDFVGNLFEVELVKTAFGDKDRGKRAREKAWRAEVRTHFLKGCGKLQVVGDGERMRRLNNLAEVIGASESFRPFPGIHHCWQQDSWDQ